MKYWVERGVDGFRIDSIPFLIEDEQLRDEPFAPGKNPTGTVTYNDMDHIYTNNLPGTFEIVREWRDYLNEFTTSDYYAVMMVEAYANLTTTMKYYQYGADFPFNFGFIINLNNQSGASDFKTVIDNWMNNKPEDTVANWVVS